MFEKVNPSHPDKIADRIAGALVDLAYAKENEPRIAVEVLIGHGKCHIIAETSVKLNMADVKNAVQYYKYKFKDTPVLVGGIYASLMPDHCKKYTGCDEVILGTIAEAEKLIPAYDLVDVDYQILHTYHWLIH